MNRRKFIYSSSLISLLALTSKIIPSQNNTNHSIIKPKKLFPGNTVGIISPAGPLSKDSLAETIKNMEKLGLKTYHSERILNKYGYLGGSDEERAADVMEMFMNDKVDGIVCARGGYGCARMINKLDYNIIRKNPKILFGYSDITSLLMAIYSQAGLVCFHGPVGTSTFNEFSTKYFIETLIEPKDKLIMESDEKDAAGDDTEYQHYTVSSGKASGKLAGGNLSIVASLVGTPYDVDYKDKILFLEEIDEAPYRVDRMLTQMKLAGKFDGIRGIAMGIYKKCTLSEEKKKAGNSLTLHEVFNDILGDLGVPVHYGLSFGHVVNKFTLPFGIDATLDTYERTLTLNEKAVI